MPNNMDRTDEELNRDWVPNGRRPQSTVARSFSAELMDIFRIDNSIADLDEQIDKRYVSVYMMQLNLDNTCRSGILLGPLYSEESTTSIGYEKIIPNSFYRKQQVNTGQTELQLLEARLKEMEARLQSSKLPGSGNSSGPHAQPQSSANETSNSATQPTEKELPQRPLQTASRPGTAKQAQHAPMHGGAMPPTPTASEDGGDRDL
ncbi:hypothetical protein GGS20DRAFT_98195 [Poronia punctata]|nr:hypothetical protein GGS20DRAFT_98195 [Poronia punctata]